MAGESHGGCNRVTRSLAGGFRSEAPSPVWEIHFNRLESSDLSLGPRHKLSRSSLRHTKQSVWRRVNRENDTMLRAEVRGFDLGVQSQPVLGRAAFTD